MEQSEWEIPPKIREIMAVTPGCPSEVTFPALAEIVRGYVTEDGAEYNRVEFDTRKDLRKARDGLSLLIKSLTRLNSRRDFRHYNAAGNSEATSLAPHLRAMNDAEQALEQAKTRLAKRSHKNWQRMRLRAFFTEALEIRSKDLKIDAPTQAKETFNSRPFHRFLELLLEAAEPNATKAERDKMLKEGIGLAVNVFLTQKADPIYSWQWGDNFPQSEAALMKSRRFLNP